MQNVTAGKTVTKIIHVIISDDQFTVVVGCFSAVWMVASTLGIVGNTINIRTFIAMTLKDGVTVSFLVLSITDLCYSVAMFMRASATLFETFEMSSSYVIWFPVEPYAMYIFFLNCGIVLYIMTVLTTTFLAVARCMCVAKPLHFKNAFTRSRCNIILASFAVFSIFSYLPIFFNMGIFVQFDTRINSSRPMLFISSKREIVKDVVWGARDTFLPVSTQIVIIVCVVIMSKSLKESNKFRQSSRSICGIGNNCPETTTDSDKLSGKDIQVVKQVALISIVYIACNMPKIIFNIVGIIEPDLTINTPLHNLYLVTLSLPEIFQMFNSSINVIIYYTYNSKFRNCCQICPK